MFPLSVTIVVLFCPCNIVIADHFPAVLCILVAIWKHPEPRSSSGECCEAPCRVHAVFQRSCLHQEDRSRKGGEEAKLKILEYSMLSRKGVRTKRGVVIFIFFQRVYNQSAFCLSCRWKLSAELTNIRQRVESVMEV